MSTTISTPADQETVALSAINILYLSGFILDVSSAMLAFLTIRWLELLPESDKDLLEQLFSHKNEDAAKRRSQPRLELQLYTWSLFIPMPLLVLGIIFMVIGIYIYVWTQHSVAVAALVSLVGAATIPFIIGDFLIGSKPKKRKEVIVRLSEMRGDW